jgi:hypothetical protein
VQEVTGKVEVAGLKMNDKKKMLIGLYRRAAIAIVFVAGSRLLLNYLVERAPGLQKPLELVMPIIVGLGVGLYVFLPLARKKLEDE